MASFGTTSAPFTLNSGYFTGAWNDGVTVTVHGLNSASAVIDSASFVVNTSGPTLETFNWSGLSSVTFASSGGVNHGYNNDGTNFALDNLTVNAATSTLTPESSGLANMGGALLALALAGMGAAIKKRKRNLPPAQAPTPP